ncbi:MAG TPA: COX15/CtaA family protein, partial [Anaeromyxobacteraceae bacterium]|nr:COX15/CtaA family protein [Anaeromyxobacteraceae bacterium]
MKAFTRFAWSVLAYVLAVIAWGAVVRASGSGAGCGERWPTCNGQVLPSSPSVATVIEFTHRAMSGLALALVITLAVVAWRAVPPGHGVRKAAGFSLLFMLLEALLGAGLVLFGWVAKDASAARGWAMALHLINTFLLLGSLTLTAALGERPKSGVRNLGWVLPAVFAAASALAILAGITGAAAALGDTLFPSVSFAQGLR